MIKLQGILNEGPFQFIIRFLQVNFGYQKISFHMMVVNKVKKFLCKNIIIRSSSTQKNPDQARWIIARRKGLSLLTKSLASSLYNVLHKLIGLNWVTDSGLGTFGMSANFIWVKSSGIRAVRNNVCYPYSALNEEKKNPTKFYFFNR